MQWLRIIRSLRLNPITTINLSLVIVVCIIVILVIQANSMVILVVTNNIITIGRRERANFIMVTGFLLLDNIIIIKLLLFLLMLQVFLAHLYLSPLAILLLNKFLASCVIYLATLHHFASQNLLRNLVIKFVASIIIPLGFATTMIRVLYILVHNSLNCLMLLQHLNFLHKVQCRLYIQWLIHHPNLHLLKLNHKFGLLILEQLII